MKFLLFLHRLHVNFPFSLGYRLPGFSVFPSFFILLVKVLISFDSIKNFDSCWVLLTIWLLNAPVLVIWRESIFFLTIAFVVGSNFNKFRVNLVFLVDILGDKLVPRFNLTNPCFIFLVVKIEFYAFVYDRLAINLREFFLVEAQLP